MVNDWDLVVHQKQLFKLPAKVSVNHIIEQYLNHLKRQEMTAGKRSIAMEVIRGIGEYFNASLGPQLLYAGEKLQYKEECEAGGRPADIYGSAHLLRLMVKIGGYLSFANYNLNSCKVIMWVSAERCHNFYSGD